MEAQQQYAAAEMKALEMRLTKAQSEAEALRSQADQNGSAVQSRDMVIQPISNRELWPLIKWLAGNSE